MDGAVVVQSLSLQPTINHVQQKRFTPRRAASARRLDGHGRLVGGGRPGGGGRLTVRAYRECYSVIRSAMTPV